MRRVLVVEDDRLNRRLVFEQLQSVNDIVIDLAEDGATALRLLARDTYAVAIVDVGMPGLSGDALTWMLRALHGPETKVLLVSGRTDDELAALAEKCGANATLRKPFSASALGAIVSAWLR